GRGSFETLVWTGMLVRVLFELAMAAQDLGDRARRRYLHLTALLHDPFDLAATPSVVALLANTQHLHFDVLRCARRAVQRSARAIAKPNPSLRQIPLHPFVAIAPADPKTPAKLTHVRARRQCQLHELLPLIHDRLLPPRHRGPSRPTDSGRNECPRCLRTGAKSVLDVPGLHSGEGLGVGVPRCGMPVRHCTTPLPSPAPQGGREHTERAAPQ